MINPSKTEMSAEYVNENYHHYLTVGRLIEYFYKNNIPQDAKIFVQRVEDHYYGENGSWSTVKKENEDTDFMHETNKLIDSGEYFNEDNYPDRNPDDVKKYTDEQIANSRDEYSPVFCCMQDKKDLNLYLNLHY